MLVFQNGCTILHSHQQWMRVSFVPHPCQHLALSLSWILATLIGVWMWELDHKEGWALKNWCFRTVVLEKTLESPLDCKEIKSVNLIKGNQPWIFIGRTDAKAEALIFWPPDAENRLIEKDSAAGKDWRQKEKRATEDKMVGWHHQFNGREPGQTPGVGEGQGCLVCCSPWDRAELDTTWQLNNNSNL